jgi:GTP-binding protein
MKITSAEFVKSAFERSHWITDGLPEIAFLGRSNVGKSSLLNSLLGRKGLARTSNTPGRTQSLNYYRINDSFYFVDLPGYGYARVSKSVRADWGKMAEDYLSDRHSLILCIQLIDARHRPSDLDLMLNEWLTVNGKDHIVVATKTDKLSSNQLTKQLKMIKDELPSENIVPFSSVSGRGRNDLWNVISDKLKKILKNN